MEFQVIENNDSGQTTVIAFFADQPEPLVTATSDHPHWTSIVRGLAEYDATVYGLFNVASGANVKFQALGSRYSVRNGLLCRDLDPVDTVLGDQVIRFLDERVDDWQPLVKFLERVDANPSETSRNDLMKWVAAGKLTLTDEGLCVGYKSFHKLGEQLTSTVAGYAVIDGVEHDAAKRVPNEPGSVIEMPRSMVDPNSAKHCSVGLHVGTWQYASTYAGGQFIGEVHFDPADAIAVPTDDAGKIRVCRYKFINLIDSAYQGVLVAAGDYRTEAEYEYFDDPDAPDNW